MAHAGSFSTCLWKNGAALYARMQNLYNFFMPEGDIFTLF